MKHPNADAYTGGHSKDLKVCYVGDGCPVPTRDTAKTMDDVSMMFCFLAA